MTTDANYPNVKAALEALDTQRRQAMIKVVFLEVTYNDGLDFGVEGGLTHALNGSQILSYSNLFGLAQQGINPTQGVTTLAGASFLTLTGDNFAATLRAIEEKGKVNVLSRPTIIAQDKQPAQIVIGQNVPIIDGVTVSALGGTTSSINYVNVGIILNVTPYIHSDNKVEMILAPTISEVAAQSTQVSSGSNGVFSTPYINTRSANTVVTVPSGQTVVIGGLMQDSKVVTDSGVPILQSIPLLGNIFKHKVKANSKSELMIFVTPTVMSTDDDLARMSTDETSRLKISQKAFPQDERSTYIDPVAPASSSSSGVAMPPASNVH